MHSHTTANTHLGAAHAGGVACVEVHVNRVPPVVHTGTYTRAAAAHSAHRTLFTRRVHVLVVPTRRARNTGLRHREPRGESIHFTERYGCIEAQSTSTGTSNAKCEMTILRPRIRFA